MIEPLKSPWDEIYPWNQNLKVSCPITYYLNMRTKLNSYLETTNEHDELSWMVHDHQRSIDPIPVIFAPNVRIAFCGQNQEKWHNSSRSTSNSSRQRRRKHDHRAIRENIVFQGNQRFCKVKNRMMKDPRQISFAPSIQPSLVFAPNVLKPTNLESEVLWT